jgi:hypothetical protein
MLHVLEGEEVLLLLTCCTCAEGPSEALAEMCVCTARCGLRLTGMVVKLSCCLPEHEGGQGPRTKLSRHKPLTTVCMVVRRRLRRSNTQQLSKGHGRGIRRTLTTDGVSGMNHHRISSCVPCKLTQRIPIRLTLLTTCTNAPDKLVIEALFNH